MTIEALTGAMAELSRALVRKGLFGERDLPALFQAVESLEPSQPASGRQLPTPIVVGDEE